MRDLLLIAGSIDGNEALSRSDPFAVRDKCPDSGPKRHHHRVGNVWGPRAVRRLIDDELHSSGLTRRRLAQFFLKLSQQRQIRGQADQVIGVQANSVGHGAIGGFKPATKLPPTLRFQVAVEVFCSAASRDRL